MILDKLECLIGSIVTAALCIAVTIVYFEGISVPSFVPLFGDVQIIDGAIAHRLEGYVALSEKTAADAKAEEQKRQADAAKAALEAAKSRTATAEKLKDDADAELAKRIAEDTDGGCSWSPDDDAKLLPHH